MGEHSKDTGDFISFSEDWEKIKEMSLDEIIESAEILKEHHYSAIGYDEYGYEKKLIISTRSSLKNILNKGMMSLWSL